ncbi:MAG TPA: RNA polymerase sigma-70 factor [Cytophagales bacterium]|nr:RNA polymerase sigma-70 factor [Cytophagales bacterium]
MNWILLTSNRKKKFELLFKDLFKPLCGFSMKYIGEMEEAKSLVHEVFISLWEKFETLPEDTNHRSYLYTAVRNRSLNYIRDRKKLVGLEDISEQGTEETNAFEVRELEKEIELAINTLPEKCRMVFEMSRYEELKYAEIAQKMNISVKTVEAQMSKALSVLRQALAKYLSILFFIFNL